MGDLAVFTTFLRLLAGRTAREENLSDIGSDAGIAHPTVRSWLSVLETGFLLFRVPRWHRNLRKRMVKAAKLHLLDSGVACHLLGIRSPEQLATHPLRGAIFESWVVSEVLKARLHRGRPADLFHLREARGIELDLVVESAGAVIGVEAESGATVGTDFLDDLRRFAERVEEQHPDLRAASRLLYGGEREERRTHAHVVPWRRIQDVEW